MNVVNLTRFEYPLPQRSSSTQLEVDVQRVKFQILPYMNLMDLTRFENPLPQRSSSTQLEVDVQG